MNIKNIVVKDYLTKSNLPSSDYVINPYIGCTHGCKYCYANYNNAAVSNNSSKHDVYSPILVGNIMPTDKISIRNMKSCQCGQLSFD